MTRSLYRNERYVDGYVELFGYCIGGALYCGRLLPMWKHYCLVSNCGIALIWSTLLLKWRPNLKNESDCQDSGALFVVRHLYVCPSSWLSNLHSLGYRSLLAGSAPCCLIFN
jgi:hypothetical protein